MQHIINTTERTLISDIANSLEKHSMQCRCGSLAAPLHKQGHLYKCLILWQDLWWYKLQFYALKPDLLRWTPIHL